MEVAPGPSRPGADRARRSTGLCGSPASACAAPPPRRIDVGNAGTLLRLLPGWLAGQEGGALDARRRRLDPPPAGRPDRRAAAADGRPTSSAARSACRRWRSAARRCTASPTRCRSPAPRSSPACSSPGCWRRARRASSRGCRAATTASACWPPPAPRSSRDGDAVVIVSPRERLEPGEIAVPADISSAAFFIVAALLVAGSEVVLERGRDQPDPDRAADDPRADGRRDRGRAARRARRRADRPPADPAGAAARRSRSAAPRSRWRSTSCRWSPSPPASPRARRRSATPPSCGARSPTGSRP